MHAILYSGVGGSRKTEPGTHRKKEEREAKLKVCIHREQEATEVFLEVNVGPNEVGSSGTRL